MNAPLQHDLFAARSLARPAPTRLVPEILVPNVRRRVYKVSGGEGSWGAAKRGIRQHGLLGSTFLFTDTLIEDQDTYRFLVASIAELVGRPLPWAGLPAIEDFPAWEDRAAYKAFVLQLREDCHWALPELFWLTDGRDIWDIYRDERFLGNSSADPCSKRLKREPADRWLVENCDPAETIVTVGIDFTERHRFDDGAGHGYRNRMAEKGWRAEAPLCEPPYQAPWTLRRLCEASGLWVQRLYRLGFPHGNCGGSCCKAGHALWALMLRVFPERYAFCETQEEAVRAYLGADVAMLTDRRGGTGKRPLTLRALRERIEANAQSAAGLDDWGGCGCFLGAS